jgi:hypothetical protein
MNALQLKVVPLTTRTSRASERLAHPVKTSQADDPKWFPQASGQPKIPLMMADEILDYYGWVFCQRGFRNLGTTFEQFLAVVAVFDPRYRAERETDLDEPINSPESAIQAPFSKYTDFVN